jgi:serine/threonine-protein kinase
MLQVVTAERSNPSENLAGNTLEGRYRLTRRLGRGACGDVYEARALAPAVATHGKAKVAVKIIAPHLVGDEDSMARFTHEAYLGMRLSHRGLARVVDFGYVSEGRPYFAMELVKGVPLDQVLGAVGTLPRRLASDIIEEVATILEVLHDKGVVHRDVKPSNILVDIKAGRRPRVRLIDLGVAGVYDKRRAKKLGAVDDGATGSHGTPAYIAPEQALGRAVDGRADVYALGCVAYRLLTGIDPLRGSTLTQTVHNHLFETPRPATALNPALPSSVDAVLARALEKVPANRTRTAIRLAAELASALEE